MHCFLITYTHILVFSLLLFVPSRSKLNPLRDFDFHQLNIVLCLIYLHKLFLELVRVYKNVNQTHYCLILGLNYKRGKG